MLFKKYKVLFIVSLLCGSILMGRELAGQVTYDGPSPPSKEINMAADPICGRAHEDDVYVESFLLNKENNGLKNVMVWIKSPNHNADVTETPVLLNQLGCVYAPHVTGIMKGQELHISNSDQTMHNIHSMSEVNSAFNFAMPAKSENKIQIFTEVENVFYIKCDVHPWMKTWVKVLDHPFFAVTDENGAYSINLDNLSPGTYELQFWHEKWHKYMKAKGYFTQSIEINGDSTNVDAQVYVFKQPGKKKK